MFARGALDCKKNSIETVYEPKPYRCPAVLSILGKHSNEYFYTYIFSTYLDLS